MVIPKRTEQINASSRPIPNKLNMITTPVSLGPKPPIANGSNDGIIIAIDILSINKYGIFKSIDLQQNKKADITNKLLINEYGKDLNIIRGFRASLM